MAQHGRVSAETQIGLHVKAVVVMTRVSGTAERDGGRVVGVLEVGCLMVYV